MESNRGEISKFTIVRIELSNTSTPSNLESAKDLLPTQYIKAHTCFNRIDLPHFDKQSELNKAIDYIVNNEILGFGID